VAVVAGYDKILPPWHIRIRHRIIGVTKQLSSQLLFNTASLELKEGFPVIRYVHLHKLDIFSPSLASLGVDTNEVRLACYQCVVALVHRHDSANVWLEIASPQVMQVL
jgi:hypothetical protein